MSDLNFSDFLRLTVESGLTFQKHTADDPETERRDWLMFSIGSKLESDQIKKLQEIGELRFLSKGYVALKPHDDELREYYGKEAL